MATRIAVSTQSVRLIAIVVTSHGRSRRTVKCRSSSRQRCPA
jgi:hypothetical protein